MKNGPMPRFVSGLLRSRTRSGLTQISLYYKLDCMEDNSALPDYGRRAAQYWFVDGLPDLIFGLALLVWGLVALLSYLFFPGLSAKLLMFAGGIAFLVLFWQDRKIIDAVKSWVTYPRTGYVRPPGDPETIPESRIMSLASSPQKPPEGNVTFFRLRTVLV